MVRDGFDEHDLLAKGALFVPGVVVAVYLQCEVGEVAHHEVKYLVDDVRFHVFELCLFKNKLAIDNNTKRLI
jgi:hypothetical protein